MLAARELDYDLILAVESGVADNTELPRDRDRLAARVLAPCVTSENGRSGGIIAIGVRDLLLSAKIVRPKAVALRHRVAALRWAADKRQQDTHGNSDFVIVPVYAPVRDWSKAHRTSPSRPSEQEIFWSTNLPDFLSEDVAVQRNSPLIIAGDYNNVTHARLQEWKETLSGTLLPADKTRGVASDRAALTAFLDTHDLMNPLEHSRYSTHGRACKLAEDGSAIIARRAIDHTTITREHRSLLRKAAVIDKLAIPWGSDHNAIAFSCANLSEIQSYVSEGKRMPKFRLDKLDSDSWGLVKASITGARTISVLSDGVSATLRDPGLCGLSSDRLPQNFTSELAATRAARLRKKEVTRQLRRETRTRL
ncbi:hypothetical protein, partial [Herbaspirillum sp.]|uniref:hypothetical protein n=1 Tax=Herbaspirillum sp. TaxID=1890675 RepID=UPI0025894218